MINFLCEIGDTISLAERVCHAPLKNALYTASQASLHDAARMLEEMKASTTHSSPVQPPSPPPSPIAEKSSHVLEPFWTAETNTIVSSTTRARSDYCEFMSQLLPRLRTLYPNRAHKLNMKTAAELWTAHKAQGSLEKVVAAALATLPAPAASPLRTVAIGFARQRSMSAESEGLPDLEDAA